MAALVLSAFVNAHARIHADHIHGPIYGRIKLVELVKSITMREILDIQILTFCKYYHIPTCYPFLDVPQSYSLFPSPVRPSHWAGWLKIQIRP